MRAVQQFQMADGNLIRRFFDHAAIRHLLLIRARLQPPRQGDLVAHIQFSGKTRAPPPRNARNIVALSVCPVYSQHHIGNLSPKRRRSIRRGLAERAGQLDLIGILVLVVFNDLLGERRNQQPPRAFDDFVVGAHLSVNGQRIAVGEHRAVEQPLGKRDRQQILRAGQTRYAQRQVIKFLAERFMPHHGRSHNLTAQMQCVNDVFHCTSSLLLNLS